MSLIYFKGFVLDIFADSMYARSQLYKSLLLKAMRAMFPFEESIARVRKFALRLIDDAK